MGTEVERKWILRSSNELRAFVRKFAKIPIHQFYTKITDEEEVRYRSKNGEYIKTIKRGSGLMRAEDEEFVNLDEFQSSEDQMIGKPIIKLRYLVKLKNYEDFYDELTLEIDYYIHPKFVSRAILEIEFKNEDEAENFRFNDALKKILGEPIEVTDDKRYKNKSIALHGFPEE